MVKFLSTDARKDPTSFFHIKDQKQEWLLNFQKQHQNLEDTNQCPQNFEEKSFPISNLEFYIQG